MTHECLRLTVNKRPTQRALAVSCVTLSSFDASASSSEGASSRSMATIATTNDDVLRALASNDKECAIVGFWESKDAFDPLAALHFLARDAGGAPSFSAKPRRDDDEARKELEALHLEMVRENKSAVIRISAREREDEAGGKTSEAREVHLVAVPDSGASEETCVFIAFETAEMSPAYAQPLLVQNRLVVVLDLDETLLQATTLPMLDRKIEIARARLVSLMKFDITNPRVSAVMVEEVKKDRQTCEIGLRRLTMDRALLWQYISEEAVTCENRRAVTLPEIETLPNGQQALRGVIRIPSPHIRGSIMVFTKINPADPSTAMLVHVRPGWEEMRAYLSGSDSGRSKRAEVFVCTMSNNFYAREMWRILDQHGTIFSQALVSERVQSVSSEKLKCLKQTCGPRYPVELAVIIDDRTAVWEPDSQPHILAVTPFMPYGSDSGASIEQRESSGSGGVLGTALSMLESMRLRWHIDYGKFAVKARKYVHETAKYGVLRPPKSETVVADVAPETSVGALENALRETHERKKSERLFYPPDAGELLKPLMDLEAKQAATSIASRGGASRAAEGSGSRLLAALGALDRHNAVRIQHAKIKADANARPEDVSDGEEDTGEGDKVERDAAVEVKMEEWGPEDVKPRMKNEKVRQGTGASVEPTKNAREPSTKTNELEVKPNDSTDKVLEPKKESSRPRTRRNQSEAAAMEPMEEAGSKAHINARSKRHKYNLDTSSESDFENFDSEVTSEDADGGDPSTSSLDSEGEDESDQRPVKVKQSKVPQKVQKVQAVKKPRPSPAQKLKERLRTAPEAEAKHLSDVAMIEEAISSKIAESTTLKKQKAAKIPSLAEKPTKVDDAEAKTVAKPSPKSKEERTVPRDRRFVL